MLSGPIFKHSDTKLNLRKHSVSQFRGGVRVLRPRLDPPLHIRTNSHFEGVSIEVVVKAPPFCGDEIS